MPAWTYDVLSTQIGYEGKDEGIVPQAMREIFRRVEENKEMMDETQTDFQVGTRYVQSIHVCFDPILYM